MLRLTWRMVVTFAICTMACALAESGAANAQGLTSFLSSSKPATPNAATSDPLKRTTPKDSVYNLLQACHNGNFLLASQYLDLRNIRADERAGRGSELAKDLCDFLDRDPSFEVSNLSNAPEGNIADELAPNLDILDRFQEDHRQTTLYLERTNQAGNEVWLVAPDTVARIPELITLHKASSIEKKIPQPLVRTEWIDTPLWIWLTLTLLALVIGFVSRLLSRGVLLLVAPIVKRYAKSFSAYRLENFSEPIRLLLALAVFRACMSFIPPSALLRDYILKLITFLAVLGVASLLMRFVDLISDRVIARLNPRERTVSYSVAPLLVRFVKICVFCIAILFILTSWGYNTTTILAGVGVGGLAVALAAQKTIENLFGGISLISDRAVLVGDFCQFGGQLGTVEDIGLRSTRIRTLDRTLVTIPNSQFSTMTLENYSKRDRMWFHPSLHLHRDTSAAQLRDMMSAVADVLHAHPMVDPTDVPLRFTKIANDAYVLDVFAYVLTPDFNEYLKVQSDLLLRIMETARQLGVVFALPIQESVTPNTSPFRSQNIEVDV